MNPWRLTVNSDTDPNMDLREVLKQAVNLAIENECQVTIGGDTDELTEDTP